MCLGYLKLSGSQTSDPAPLGRAAAVVRNGGHVLDLTDLEAGRLQAADGGLAAGAGTLHEDVDLAHPVLHRLAGGVLGRHLRREGRGLAGALEPDVPGAGPRDHGPVGVADRHDRVVERALDVRVAVRDVLLLLAPHLLRRGLLRCGGHYFLPTFFLPATVLRGPLRPRALVWVRWPRTGRPRRWRIPW